jgi:hypothetical protein
MVAVAPSILSLSCGGQQHFGIEPCAVQLLASSGRRLQLEF